MIPGRIEGATHHLGAPRDWDPARDGDCCALAIRAEQQDNDLPRLTSAWFPTPEEIAAIAAGAPVYLSIVGASHPPVWLEVGPTP